MYIMYVHICIKYVHNICYVCVCIYTGNIVTVVEVHQRKYIELPILKPNQLI